MLKSKYLAAFFLCAFLTPAFAQSLAEKEKQAHEDKAIAEAAESTFKKCKVNIKVTFDWSTFNMAEIKKNNNSVSSYCEDALSAINYICEHSEDGLKAVQDKIKSLTCKQSSPHILSLQNGEMVYGIDFKDSNIMDMVRKYLMDNL